MRGLGIANSIAETGRSYLLTENIPRLTSMLFDARLGERRLLISYIFIQDKQGRITAHTFTRPFPEDLSAANGLQPDQASNIRLFRIGEDAVYDIAVPIREGIYQIGVVRVGLFKRHIDALIGKLRTTFLGFVTVIFLFCFLISHRLARYITRPISKLTEVSDALSRGRFDVLATPGDRLPGPERIGGHVRDEVRQLAASFYHMTQTIRESQAQLMDSEQKYRSLFAGGPNPIFVIDRSSNRILDANPTAEDVYGYSREALIGRHFTLLGPFDFPDIPQGTDAGTTSFDTITISSKERYYKKGRQPIYVNVHACPARYAGKDALIVATTDITEMVEKDGQLIQFGKLKTLGEMSAGIAHELNQPLNAIKMGSEYLEMAQESGRAVSAADIAVAAGEISRQVDRAADIIQRLREFGRKSDFTRDRISINQPVTSVVPMVERQLKLQNIDLELDLAPDPPVILAHSNRLEQVIFNLITNARDALQQKGDQDPTSVHRIRIETGRENGRAIVTVSDNGIGISPEDRKRIFDAFFTTKEMGEGMGLGLSISNGIVEDYGGQIRVDSKENEGTRFRLSFPVA
jgi:PAS domain S-box-containing protein